MFQILEKRRLNETTTLMRVHAPRVAKKAGPGQFIILRIDENGERIPLTIAGYDRESGSVTIIFQKVGKTTIHLDELETGDSLLDFVGPLGRVSEYGDVKGKRVAVIGGGLGIAIAYPQAVALTELGAEVDMIVGFRNIGLAILMGELQNASKNLIVMTDDGSNGKKGFVTDALREQLEAGVKYEHVVAIGPMPMMRAVCEMTRPYGIHTVVSMNPIMIDGTGMCGGCRLTVDGKIKFACVDGPDFDGHQVDFDEAIRRSKMYADQERQSMDEHCHLMQQAESSK